MSFKTISMHAVAIVLLSVLAVSAGSASASHIDFEQRRAEREAARVAREAEREARRIAREEARNNDDEQEVSTCSCAASLRFAKPDVQFKNGVLSLVPRVDITIRSRGETDAPKWNALLAYEGTASYSSEDVAVPADHAFGGSQDVVGGSCGTDYTLKGRALPGVTLPGVLQSLVGPDQELTGTIRMQATLAGCGDTEEENRQLEIRVREFGNLKVGSWRTVR